MCIRDRVVAVRSSGVSRHTVHVRLFIFKALLEGCACDLTCSSRCFCKVEDISSSSSNRLISSMILGRFRDLASASLDVELRRRGASCKSSTRGNDALVVGMMLGMSTYSNENTSSRLLFEKSYTNRDQNVQSCVPIRLCASGSTRNTKAQMIKWFQISTCDRSTK